MNTQLKQMSNVKHFLAGLLVLLVSFAMCFGVSWKTGLLTSGFHFFINDHAMISMANQTGELGLWRTIQTWVLLDHRMGRFVPFHYTLQAIMTYLLGLNSFYWFVYIGILASLSVFFLFMFAWLIEMPFLAAIVFPGFALVAAADMWARPSYTQGPGAFLLSLALFLSILPNKFKKFSKVIDLFLIISVLSSSLIKESFIIFIPALILIKAWFYSRENGKSLYESFFDNRIVFGILTAIFVLELTYIFTVIGADGMGYAGIQEDTFDIANIWRSIVILFEKGDMVVFLISSAVAIALTLWKRVGADSYLRYIFPYSLITFAIVSPQILLYSKSGIDGFFNNYLIPATIGTALVISASLAFLNRHSRLLFYGAITLSLVLIFSKFPPFLRGYHRLAQDSFYMNELIRQADRCTPDEKYVLIALNPRVRYEAAGATRTAFNHLYDREKLVLATYGLEGTDFFSDTYKEAEKAWSFLSPQSVSQLYEGVTIGSFENKEEISSVIVFDQLDEEFFQTSGDWFEKSKFSVEEYPVSFAFTRLYCKESQ
ncbi:MAG: hypothetical protein F6K30_19730 [Cyanothece sp. SIO2G6]|nr:hypothetical protein [Cyanothece sp. SIO2G6]